MGKKRMSIRFNDRTLMLLTELSSKTGSKMSVLIRSLVIKGIDELIDDTGNLNLDEKQIQAK